MPIVYLNQKIEHKVASVAEVKYAVNLGGGDAIKIELQKHKKGSEQWLRLAQRWGKEQIEIGALLSEFYLSHEQFDKAILWFDNTLKLNANSNQQSLHLNYIRLFIERLMDKRRYQVIKGLTNELVPGFYAFKALIEIAMIEGDSTAFFVNKTHLLNLSKSIKHGSNELVEINNFLQKLDDYRVSEFFMADEIVAPIAERILLNNKTKNCIRSLQFIAAEMDDLMRVESFIKQLEESELQGVFCFSKPRYISKKLLVCNGDKPREIGDNKNDKAINCKVSQWATFAKTISEDYVGVVVTSGKANVHGGVLYIDKHDNLSVLKHELLHLLGFVDEYALNDKHPFCEADINNSNAHNVAVIPKYLIDSLKNSTEIQLSALREEFLRYIPWAKKISIKTPIFNKNNERWKLGTPDSFRNEIGIFVSKTCVNHGLVSVKPISTLTALEYFDASVPTAYLEIFKQAPNKYLMQNFYHRVSQELMSKGEVQLSQSWYEAAIKKENAHISQSNKALF